MKRFLIWGSVILGMVLLVVLLANIGSSTAPKTTLRPEVGAADHKNGAENPKVTIVEYSDFQCPGCAQYYPMMKQLVQEFPNEVAIVYRHYPLKTIHDNAEKAAQAAEAADKQGKFWDMHDVLFNTQNTWANMANPEEQFQKYAGSLGLNIDQFKTDMASAAVAEKVRNDENDAASMNLRGTPSFFLNNSLLTQSPQTYDAFKKLVTDYLAK